jgi:hypothetical protein
MEKANAKAQIQYLKEKSDWEQQKDEAEVEENRLAAKNYITGTLAKLGALITTSAAVQGIAGLEQKYQKQAQDVRMAYNFEKKALDLKLDETIDAIESDTANKIYDVKNNLSKSQDEVWKEIVKLEQTADRATLNIVDKFAGEFRTTKDKYRKERESAAKKYANDMASIISNYDVTSLKGFSESKAKELPPIPGWKGPGKGFAPMTTLAPNEASMRAMSPQFVEELIKSGKLSAQTVDVLRGKKELNTYVESTQRKIRSELEKYGLDGSSSPSSVEGDDEDLF